MGGKPQQPQQPQMKLGPTKLPTVSCENCDSIFWEEVTMFKEVPGFNHQTDRNQCYRFL